MAAKVRGLDHLAPRQRGRVQLHGVAVAEKPQGRELPAQASALLYGGQRRRRLDRGCPVKEVQRRPAVLSGSDPPPGVVGAPLFLAVPGQAAPQQAGAVLAGHGQGVAGPGVDQRPGLLDVRARPGQKILHALKGPLRPGRDQTLPGGQPQALDGHQPHPHPAAVTAPGVLAPADAGGLHGQPQTPGLGDVGEGAVEAAAVLDHRGHELRRVVHLEVGRLERDPRVAGAVGFAERVALEAHHHGPHALLLIVGHPPGAGAVGEPPGIVTQLLLAILFG